MCSNHQSHSDSMGVFAFSAFVLALCAIVVGGRYLSNYLTEIRQGMDCAGMAREKGWIKSDPPCLGNSLCKGGKK